MQTKQMGTEISETIQIKEEEYYLLKDFLVINIKNTFYERSDCINVTGHYKYDALYPFWKSDS